jgi:DNA-binding MurR/RpiR family transcriptional regulator
VLAATLADRIDLINRVDRELDRTAFRRAVELTAGAKEILVCGLAALVVAEHTANRLTRIGHRARHIADVGVRLAHQLVPLGPDDLVLAVAQNRPAHEMRVVLEHAQRVGAKSVLVTETLGEALRDKVDVLIKVPQGAPEMFGSQMGTFIVLEALTMAVAAKDEERSLRALTAVSELRGQLEGEPPARTNGKVRKRRG